MGSRLSTFSSELRRTPLPWVLAAIAATELAVSHGLPRGAHRHEFDALLARVDAERTDADVVILGDSVAQNLFDRWPGRPAGVTSLAANQAIELPGHYWLLRRYLDANRAPRAVVFVGHDPLGGNLRQPFTENYVQRCFTRWREIADLTAARRSPVFGLKMVLYKALTTFRHRVYIQKALSGHAHADGAATRAGGAAASGGGGSTPHGALALADRWLERHRLEPLGEAYLGRLAAELGARGIPLVYVPAPRAERVRAAPATAGADRQLAAALARIRGRHPNLVVRDDLLAYYPDDWFFDGIHPRHAYRARVRAALLPLIESLLQTAHDLADARFPASQMLMGVLPAGCIYPRATKALREPASTVDFPAVAVYIASRRDRRNRRRNDAPGA